MCGRQNALFQTLTPENLRIYAIENQTLWQAHSGLPLHGQQTSLETGLWLDAKL